jgi:hypothetical protein
MPHLKTSDRVTIPEATANSVSRDAPSDPQPSEVSDYKYFLAKKHVATFFDAKRPRVGAQGVVCNVRRDWLGDNEAAFVADLQEKGYVVNVLPDRVTVQRP